MFLLLYGQIDKISTLLTGETLSKSLLIISAAFTNSLGERRKGVLIRATDRRQREGEREREIAGEVPVV